jgi:hypothetical protein
MKSLQEILHLPPTSRQTLQTFDVEDSIVVNAVERSKRRSGGSVSIGRNGFDFWVEQKGNVTEIRTRGLFGTGWLPARVSFITVNVQENAKQS